MMPGDKQSPQACNVFDESIFTDPYILRDVQVIGVTNPVDAFLVKRFQKTPTYLTEDATIVLNPKIMSRSCNIWTMDDSRVNDVHRSAFNNAIVVMAPTFNIKRARPIRISEYNSEFYKPDYVFDIPGISDVELTSSLAVAILVKFFSVYGQIRITTRLYSMIYKHFDTKRSWFVDTDMQPIPTPRRTPVMREFVGPKI